MSAAAGAGLPTLGLTLPQFNDRPGPALDACRDAWELGFGGVFVFDHFWPLGQPQRPALEGWTLLAALAARVGPEGSGEPRRGAPVDREGSGEPQGGAPVDREAGRFRVGTLVTRAGVRNPGLVARMAATVAEILGAPPIIGIGRGDVANRDENLAFGLPFGGPAERTAALEATVAALHGPLGRRPEVWVGGTGPSALALAGRLGDAWNGWGRTAEELAAGLGEVRRAAEGAGRDPAAVAGTWGGQVLVAADGREAKARLAAWGADRPPAEVARVIVGDPEAVLARLAALADAGATWCVLAPVGGPGAEARALLAAAAGLTGRTRAGTA